jgi:general stress protein 26
MNPPARSAQQRKQDTLNRLEHDVDAWVATADATGTPYLLPLSFRWDGGTMLFSTPARSRTGRNLRPGGTVRVSLGHTRDVVMIEGSVELIAAAEIGTEIGDAFAAKAGFDPREDTSPYTYFHLQPRRLQAWREVNELAGRDLMRDGVWLI